MSAYTTLAQLKSRIQKTNPDADAFLPQIIDAASRAIDRFCNRPDGFEASDAATVRYYTGNGKGYLLIDETVEIELVSVKESPSETTYTAWTTPTAPLAGDGDWIPFSGDPKAPDFNSLPYDSIMVDPNGSWSYFTGGRWRGLAGFRPYGAGVRGLPTVQVLARWGYSDDIPDDIKQACIMQSAIFYKRLQSSGASVLASTELGTLEFYKTIDPMVELILVSGRYLRVPTGRR
jgi:hypothetical protein